MMELDLLPFLRLTGTTTEEKINEIVRYLNQLKEAIEISLLNISTENLSPELVKQLRELGVNAVQSRQDREELEQIVNKNKEAL